MNFCTADDLADAELYLLQSWEAAPVANFGCGRDVTIRESAELVLSVICNSVRPMLDPAKPDGRQTRKLPGVWRLSELGWQARIAPKSDIEGTYAWFREHFMDARL